MGLRTRCWRLAAAAMAATVVAAVVPIASAGATTPSPSVSTSGGTAVSNQTAVGLSFPDLLETNLLSDTSQATTLSVAGVLGKVTPIQLSSNGASNLNPLVNPMVAQLPGGSAGATEQLNLGATLDQSGLLVGGALPLNLLANLGPAKASLAATANMAGNLDLAGGLVSLDALSSTLAESATSLSTTVQRTLHIGRVTLVNLGDVLSMVSGGVGLDISVPQLSALMTSLGLTVPSAAGVSADLSALVNDLLGTINSLLNPVAIPSLSQSVQVMLSHLASGTLPSVATTALLPDVPDLLAQAKASLANLLDAVFATLGTTPLITVNNTDLSVTTTAAATTSASVASAVCSVGSIQVGASAPITLAANHQSMASLSNQVAAQLSGLPLGLGKLVQLTVCGHPISGPNVALTPLPTINGASGSVSASASVDALEATVHPAALAGVITDGADSLSGILGGAQLPALALPHLAAINAQLPNLELAMKNLGVSKTTSGLVSQGATISVGSVSASTLQQGSAALGSASVQSGQLPAASAASATPTGDLATTGNNAGPTEAAAAALVLLALAALTVRRRLRSNA